MKLVTFLLSITVNQAFGQAIAETSEQSDLIRQIVIADSIFFQALNDCDLKSYEHFLTDDFEFYHDRGGLTKSREAEMKSINTFCGEQRKRQTLRRELVKESVEINPIRGYGAIEAGRHRFYLVIDAKTEKMIEEARFMNVWQQTTSGWKLSRVLSYDHRPVCNIQLTSNILNRYTGAYQMSPERTIFITSNNGLLSAKDGDWNAELCAESDSMFYLNYGNVQFEFVSGKKGIVDKLVIYENGTKVEEGVRKR
jgi:hypothetical protein